MKFKCKAVMSGICVFIVHQFFFQTQTTESKHFWRLHKIKYLTSNFMKRTNNLLHEEILVKKLQCTKLFKSVILVDAGDGESGIVQVLEYGKTT